MCNWSNVSCLIAHYNVMYMKLHIISNKGIMYIVYNEYQPHTSKIAIIIHRSPLSSNYFLLIEVNMNESLSGAIVHKSDK